MKADEHPVYRAKFYIPELKKSVSWKEYLDYYNDYNKYNDYRNRDRDIESDLVI